MKRFNRLAVALLLLRGLSVPVFANLLGGGTNGASVTLTDNGDGTVTMSGTNLVISGSGGTSNWAYVVLTSPNLTTPVWTPAVTNQFDASGDFDFTNDASPAQPQAFFKLLLR